MSSSPRAVGSQNTKGFPNDGGLPWALVSYNDELPKREDPSEHQKLSEENPLSEQAAPSPLLNEKHVSP